jgi:hypothetical protein
VRFGHFEVFDDDVIRFKPDICVAHPIPVEDLVRIFGVFRFVDGILRVDTPIEIYKQHMCCAITIVGQEIGNIEVQVEFAVCDFPRTYRLYDSHPSPLW